jgi:rhodanese-related sulfurtransferase
MKNVLFVFLVLSTFACTAQQTASSVEPETFEKGIAAGNVQVFDVRTAGEFNNGHLKNALLADWNNKTQFYDRVQYLDKDKAVYIYCLAGGRSAAAATWMRANGFSNVVELKGGITAWKMANKPLEGNSDTPQLTLEQYLSAIPAASTALVDFGASWCPPCVKMAPVIDELKLSPDLHFTLIKVDAGIHTDVMKALNIGPIPVFIIYKNGKETWRHEGVVSKEELTAQLQ